MMIGVRAREAVRRRAARVGLDDDAPAAAGARCAIPACDAAQKLLEYTTKHYSSVDNKDMKVLRRRLVQAGIYDPRAPAVFFLGPRRAGGGLGGDRVLCAADVRLRGQVLVLAVRRCCGGLFGYLAPSLYLDRRIARKRLEHQSGFPGFHGPAGGLRGRRACAWRRRSTASARELGDSYPSLSANIHMANLEIRAGRTMTEALEHFGDRLGLEEARSFATLIQQSDELGSSISDALRVYSDDMRHKRLSRAEEKAYSLPAKLAVPMMVCIFPVLFVVILLPVIVRVATHNW